MRDHFFVTLLGERHSVAIRRSPRARRVTLRLTAEGFVVTIPPRTPLAIAQDLIDHNHAWMIKQTQNLKKRRESLPEDQVLIRGQIHTILLSDTRPTHPVDSENRTVTIPAATFAQARPIVKQVLTQYSRWLLPQIVAEEAARTGLKPTKVVVRDQRTKWGSCSTKGTLSLNWRLVMAPREVAHYLVIHELAHLKEMNHSPAFWNLVAHHCPDFERHDRWLTKEGWRLMMAF